VDVAGAFGQNKLTSSASLQTVQPLTANYHNNNWFVSANGLYRNTWKKFIFKSNLGGFYSQISSGAYQFSSFDQTITLDVASLLNKATLLLENAELGYGLTPEIEPFVNGGLIQVVQFSNSRPLLTTVVNGSLPQLNLNKNGFRLGGGFTFKHKQLTVRLEEKYYNASGSFISYQTFLALEYQIT
ncbi:MAG: autotransporter outer membrane beta-barrel domain-containing protein, partial [Legionellales bacterium]